MKKYLTLVLFSIGIININSQTRSGLSMGFQYEMTSHTNAYVYLDNKLNGFEDNTNYLYFPFSYSIYSKYAYSEFSTNAFHLLFVGALNLLNPNKEYKYTTDKAYFGDSYADGYVPTLNDFNKNTSKYWNLNQQEGIEASFNDTDLLRFVFAATTEDWFVGLPILIGAQGGIGQMGIHLSKVRKGSEPSPIKTDASGLISFNDATDLYFGANVGYVTEIMGNDLAMLLVQYDWYYFINGVEESGEEMLLNGNKITFELTYFPFDNRESYLKDLHFKLIYKTSTVPFMKKFVENNPVDYTFTKIALGVNYFVF